MDRIAEVRVCKLANDLWPNGHLPLAKFQHNMMRARGEGYSEILYMSMTGSFSKFNARLIADLSLRSRFK